MVNAANAALMGGGGVDGAIHRAGGPTILEQCRKIGRCDTGSSVLTGAGKLPAKWVAHAVGPVWNGGNRGEPAQRAGAYRRSFELADDAGARHVAASAISTGVYGYPWPVAAEVALEAVRAFIATRPRHVRRITLVLFSADLYTVFQETLFRLFPEPDDP